MALLNEVQPDSMPNVSMLLAVLEKRAGFQLGTKDVFLNITGGISSEDPALDLAVVAAILSSHHDIAIEKNIALRRKLVFLASCALFQNSINVYAKPKN